MITFLLKLRVKSLTLNFVPVPKWKSIKIILQNVTGNYVLGTWKNKVN